MDNIHECANDICVKFSELVENFLQMIIMKKYFPPCENSKTFCHLQNNLRELLIYNLLSESTFNLFCLLISLVFVLAFESLKIATSGEAIETTTSLARKRCFYIPN